MLRFQVSSRTVKSPAGPPKKRPTPGRRWWYAFLRIQISLIILSALTTLAITYRYPIFLILLPLCTAIVVTRSQLSNLLHGTLLYGLLTLCLALTYFGSIIGLQFLLHDPYFGVLPIAQVTETNLMIIVATTLFMAVLFEPVRARAQAFIEERFNLRNRQAVKAVESFTSTLREEIDLDQLRERLLDTIQKAMQPQSVSLWVRMLEQDKTESQPAQARSEDKRDSGWLAWREEGRHEVQERVQEPVARGSSSTAPSKVSVADTDPMLDYALHHLGAIEIDRLQWESPALHVLKTDAVEIALPLASQGELIGLLTLGSRLNGQEYTREDRSLLNTLAGQVAPALRVAQMVRVQQAQVRERERIEQELRTAQDIQHTFLPKDVPALPGWQIARYYRPAREVGGDFYDFLTFEDGRLGLVIGDVTDKGIPAALVMTATRTMLRTAAQEQSSPGQVLARVNDLLYADIPASMFVTCFYAILDPGSGKLHFANAGHEPPFRRQDSNTSELWATGMPLGMLPGSCYEEHEATLATGESLLFYSDGLVEAHNAQHDMFGFPRLTALIGEHAGGPELIDFLLNNLATFTGSDWEQEDDVTLLVLHRTN